MELLALGLCYRWAARLFFYPDDRVLVLLRDGSAQGQLAAAVAHLADPQPIRQALAALWAAWNTAEAGGLSLPAEHTYLFARQVLVPIHEAGYAEAGGIGRPQDLSRLAELYAAFGFQVAERAKDLPDHLAIQLEFVSALYLKEAYALEQGWTGRARVAGKGRATFLREHLVWWYSPFEEKLRANARLPFYPALASWVGVLLAEEDMAAASAPARTIPATRWGPPCGP